MGQAPNPDQIEEQSISKQPIVIDLMYYIHVPKAIGMVTSYNVTWLSTILENLFNKHISLNYSIINYKAFCWFGIGQPANLSKQMKI